MSKSVKKTLIVALVIAMASITALQHPKNSSKSDSSTDSAIQTRAKIGSQGADYDSSTKPSTKRPRVLSSNNAILKRLHAAAEKKDSRELISLVAELHESKLLLSSEVSDIYKYQISFFTSTELAELANAWPDEINTKYTNQLMVISRLISERDDPRQYLDFMANFSSDNGSREDMILKMGQKLSMFSANEIGKYVDQFSASDMSAIAEALIARVDTATNINAKKIEGLSEYLNVLSSEELISPIVREYLSLSAKDDPLGTLEWVKAQEPKIVSMCDKPMIAALINDHPQQATDYVNSILTGPDQERADNALRYMVESYTKKNPEEALSWVLSLPDEAGVFDQLIATPFLKIKSTNPERAKEIVDSIQNQKIKSLLERISK